MALSLMLRSANKIPGRFPCLSAIAIVPINNTTSFSHSSFKIASNFGKQTTTKVLPITKPAVRNLGSSDFRLLWTIERALSLALVGLVPAAIAYPTPYLDNACAVIVCLHQHWGLESCCQDYIKAAVFGTFLSKLAIVYCFLITSLTLGGLLYFNYHDVGIGCGLRRFWSFGKKGRTGADTGGSVIGGGEHSGGGAAEPGCNAAPPKIETPKPRQGGRCE